MQKQEIQNVNLILNSEEGIKPIQNYAGIGFLTKDSSGFHFTEKVRYKRIRNVRIAKLEDGTFIMYERRSGNYRIQVIASADEMNQKAILAKIAPMLKEAREGGLI